MIRPLYILPVVFLASLFGAVVVVKAHRAPLAQAMEAQTVQPATDVESVIFAAADRFGVPRNLARAVLTQESGGDPRSTSAVGAAGLMQVMPATAAGIAAELGYTSYDLYDPQTNATFGMYYLSQKLQRYGVAWGLAAYNWGPAAVDAFQARHPGMAWDDALACCAGEIPGETRGYVRNILAMAEETQPSVSLPAQSYTAPALQVAGTGCLEPNVTSAYNHSPGLQQITIPPGADWSFNEQWQIASDQTYCAGQSFVGGGVCNMASRYSNVARNLGLQVSSQYHGYVYDSSVPPEDNLAIMSSGGRGGQDLVIQNTTGRTVVITASLDGGQLIVSGGFQ